MSSLLRSLAAGMTLLLVFLSLEASGQQQGRARTIHVLYSHHYYYEDSANGLEEWLGGEVRLRHDSTYLFCDTAYLLGGRVDAVGNTSVVQGDSLRIFADTLSYDGQLGLATLTGRVLLINGEQRLVTQHLVYNTKTRQATYSSGAWLSHDDTHIYSNKGIYSVNQQTAYFSDSVQVQSPDMRLKADSLYYRIPEDRVYFTGPTRIKQGASDLYCESGYYALGEGYGWFEGNAQFADSTQQAAARRIFYDRVSDVIRLIGDADYQGGRRQARGDTLEYRQTAGDFTIRGSGFLQDGDQVITADGIEYNTRTERFRTLGRTAIQDGAQSLWADRVYTTDTTDFIRVEGEVVWRDTSAGLTLTCAEATYARSTGYLEARGLPPMLISEINGDSLYLVADIIRAVRQSETDSSRLIQAYPRVFVYKSDLQVICDSLVWIERDSLFTFYKDPVVWSDTSQFTADTISLRMADGQMDSILLRRQSLIISSLEGRFFNQVKGRNITGKFEEALLQRMFVLGNAEAIYYARDERDAFIGVNRSECSDMTLLLAENQIRDIFFIRDPKSVMHPMGQVDHDSLRLEGFRWREKERPLGVEDILRRWRDARGIR